MATITLSELYIHDGADLADYVTTDGFANEDSDHGVLGAIRSYAAGRRRIIRRTGTAKSLSVTFPYVDRTTVAWLEDHAGETMMLRDPAGRLVWGTYFSVEVAERGSAQLPDASFTFESTTASEEV